MDGTVLLIAGLLLLVLVGPWIFAWRIRYHLKRDRETAEDRFRDLTRRVYALEQAVKALRDLSPERPARVEAAEPATVAPEPASPKTEFSEISVARNQASASAIVPPSPSTRMAAPEVPSLFQKSVGGAVSGPRASILDRLKRSLDVEETLGTNWLNKLGIVILVLGVAFFLAYQLKTLGPAGKVLVGYVVGSSLLGAGIWLEKHDRYRVFARAGIGGGWALLFFTTYAMYHVPAAQILRSQLSDLLLLLAVAVVMVWHTLRYRSQAVTGLAFLLAFLTVTVSHSNVYSLSAGALLAFGLVVIVGRMQWFELEIFGILASYFNHYLWLRPIVEPMRRHHHPFAEFPASVGILVLYWLIFRVSYILRKPPDKRSEGISSCAALLNSVCLLILFKYQSAHPEWAFGALLGIGAAEFILAQLPVTRRRRTAVIVLSTISGSLFFAAFPFRYSGMRLSIFWLAEAEALLLIGVWTREVVFRRLGAIVTAVVAGQMISVEVAAVYGMRLDGADVTGKPPVATLLAVAAIVFYVNSYWVSRRWRDLFKHEFDRTLFARFSYAGAFMALTGAWVMWPEAWTAVAWTALGFVLVVAGWRWRLLELGYQANFMAAVAVLRGLAINLEATTAYHGITHRLISVLLTAALLYGTSRWSWAGGGAALSLGAISVSAQQFAKGSYTWAASFLLSLLAWYELRPLSVAVAWMVGGLVLLEAGLGWRSFSLRLQAYVAFVASFTRIFFVNLNASGNPGEISPRFYTVMPLALAFFFAYWRLYDAAGELTELERKCWVTDLCCWLGVLTVGSLMRFELEADWVAAGWAALALVVLALAWRSGRRVFLYQALLFVLGVLFRTMLHNFYQRSYFPAPVWDSRWLCVGAVVALLFLSLPILFKLRNKVAADASESRFVFFLKAMTRRPEQVFFFIGLILMTVLLAVEMRHGMVTLSWGIEGVAIFLIALWLGERSFRLSGLGLLLLCVGRILTIDVWHVNARDRYLTFMVLGTALLAVSFLYTRNREKLRHYL